MFHLASLTLNKIKKDHSSLMPFWALTFFFVAIPSILIIYFSFGLSGGATLEKQADSINGHIITSFFSSVAVSILTTALCLCIGLPLAYCIFEFKSTFLKALVILLVSAPIWSNWLIKLIGLKSIFDYFNGSSNSTYGLIYNVIGLTYIFLPLTVITIFNTLNNISKNIMLASMDLGFNKAETFIKVILPYLKGSIVSAILLVFLPSLFSLSVNEFLNNSLSSKVIAEKIMVFAQSWSQDYGRSLMFFLVLVIIGLSVASYVVVKLSIKIVSFLNRKIW